MRIGEVEDAAEQEEHQGHLDQEPDERGEMEVEGHIPAAEPVVHGKRRGGHGTVRGVIRQRAEQGAVGEEARHVAQVADVWVAGDRVEVVKVEAVDEMVCIGGEDGGGKGRAETEGSTLAER